MQTNNESIKKNIFFLLFVQGTNYLFPLLTFPYISHIIGPDGFGKIAFAQAIITYLMFVVDFGFNLTVTKAISICHKNNNVEGIRELFNSTIFAKIIIFIIIIIITTPIVFYFKSLYDIRYLIIVGYLSLIGAVFFPVWYFQGIQQMKGIAIASTIAKVICILFVFVFVKNKDDLIEVMFIYSLNFLSAAAVSFFYLRKNSEIYYKKPVFKEIKNLFIDSFPIFISYLGSSIYTTVNILFLGFFLPSNLVGLYSSADKIRAVAQNILSPISQAVFPNLSSHVGDRAVFNSKLNKFSFFFLSISFLISLSLFILSKEIVTLLLDPRFYEAYKILMVLSLLPFIISIAIIYGQWGLVNIGKQGVLSKIYMSSGLFHLTHIFIAIHFFGGVGAAFSVLLTESLVSILILICFIKYREKNQHA